MNNLRVFGKFLDQPLLVSKFQKNVPFILGASAAAYTGLQVYKASPDERKEQGFKTGITLGATVLSAISAPYVASAITKRAMPKSVRVLEQENNKLIDSYLEKNSVDDLCSNILNNGKNKILKFKELKQIYEKVAVNKDGKEFLEQLIPSPENIKAKDIFSEIGYLSIYGATPVVGGILGGITADKFVNSKEWKSQIPNKIKEGAYQYLANIFLCNIGAALGLLILEKCNIKSKIGRAVGMTLGIILTGIIGGSKIANIISRKIIDPIYNKQQTKERTPEILDISLHTDDIATVSLLSGLKWIEPALPIMYSVSGYRAGIGYRN